MVKILATSPHDPLGITDSACKNQLAVVSVQYGPFNPYHATVAESTLVKVTVASAGGNGISRYGDISVTHEDLLALVRIEVAAGRHRA
ncbi:pectinesterase inhibitor-like [Dorcoceras hygrometricum]|uniref:Pectinesterase inhibitor-like n=1 Tax=Dorcoceras hygrometricum TaxID=472368 RepID=A0A2Z7DH98_9LAMI|nr:pectinesterase inhibitor-like [Dorcoceras hygrometricum]